MRVYCLQSEIPIQNKDFLDGLKKRKLQISLNGGEMTRTSHTITAEQVKLLISEGEGLIVEFKKRYTPRIDQDIVAFANARGGTLLLGVRDDGSIAGERLTNDMKAKINSLMRNCKPVIAVNHSQSAKW